MFFGGLDDYEQARSSAICMQVTVVQINMAVEYAIYPGQNETNAVGAKRNCFILPRIFEKFL
jgi:hypothetical protein